MPATTTKSTTPTKKAGTPKAKGAVRAKSGCYTCRIRRKKCDEQPNESGHCQTCVRLRLQCLGFGAKRPEWLRENRNVVELREKIKNFLAAQGMIKGHSGSGPRSAEHEPVTLRLADGDSYEHSSSSESPPARLVSLVPDDSYRNHHMSNVRGQTWMPAMEPPYTNYGLHHSPSHPRSLSPSSSSHADDLHVTSYNTSLVPSSPALRSSLAPSYNFNVTTFSDDFMELDYEPSTFPFGTHVRYIPNEVNHYMSKVLDVQYLLGDKRFLPAMMYQMLEIPSATQEAACLLAQVHWKRVSDPNRSAVEDGSQQLINDLLNQLTTAPLTADAAVAALHVVSLFLFNGGRGAWNQFLIVATRYVTNVLFNTQLYVDPADALLNCDPKDAFVIKTALWFDVLASITTREPPQFLLAIRKMFDPARSGVQLPPDSQYSMMNPMGCENHVMWALAEAAHLSVWKENQLKKGCLSYPTLVAKANEIEQYLDTPSQQLHFAVSDSTNMARYYAAELFRTSTRLFLRSVVSGNYPHVPEINRGVKDVIKAIEEIPLDQMGVAQAVVRSTVFSFFICGALTDDQRHRDTILRTIQRTSESTAGEAGVGNCSTIHIMLKDLWQERSLRKGIHPVRWRQKLSEHGSEPFLLV